MKWFKHPSTLCSERDVAQFFDRTGLEGYGFLMLLFETVSGMSVHGNDFTASMPLSAWARRLGCHHNRAEKYFRILSEFGATSTLPQGYPRVTPGLPQGYPDITPPSNQWVTVKYAEGNIEVKIPKLFELNDNHTRNLQATCKKVSLDLDQSRIDKEEEEDQERETGAVSRRAHAEPNTLPGVQEPDPEAPSVDPLAGLPDLDAYHDTLRAWIEAQIAPAKLPRPGSAGWVKERDTLAKLHRRDCYPVEDIMGALTWMFTTDDRDAVFWRGVVKAIQPLRDKKKGDALNKFGKILDRWKGVKPAGPKLTYGMTLADLADIPENSFRRRPKEEPKP